MAETIKIRGYTSNLHIWRSQLPVDYLDASLTVNVWETVDADLSDGDPARLRYIVVEQTNNGAAAETIELEATINGTPYTWTLAGIADGVQTYCIIASWLTGGDFTPVAGNAGRAVGDAFDLGNRGDCFIVDTVGLIRVRQTTGVDVVAAQIEVNIVWDKLVIV